MPSQHKTLLILFSITLFLLGSSRSSIAIQDDPFGDPFGGGAAKKQDDDPFGGGGDDPFNPGAGKPAAGSTKGPARKNIALPKSVDKVVLAIRDTNPTTPSDFIQALRIMVDTQNFDEAKSYLDKLEAANVNDQVANALVEEIGSDFLIRLIRSEQMAPKGASFGRALLAKSTRHIKSEAQLQVFFNELTSPSPTKRNAAARGFRLSGETGLAHLVKNAAGADAASMPTYEVTAALIGSTITQPLESVLESGDDNQKAFAISVLGRSNSQKSIPYLLGFLFDKNASALLKNAASKSFGRMLGGAPGKLESKKFLRKQIHDLIKGGQPFRVNAFGRTDNWQWTKDAKFVQNQVTPQVARVIRMERLGRILYSIDPQDPESTTLFLTAQLTALKTVGTQSVSEAIQASSLSAIETKKWMEVLEFCLKNKLMEGAAGAAEVIGAVGDASLLTASGFSPLVKAMEMGDRNLRYSCTQAIIGIDPKKSFPGASRFIDSVAFFAATKGMPRAIVAHPKYSEGQNLVGTLAQRGFDATAVTTGRDLFRVASNDSDVEFILVSDAIDRPNLGELMAQLRSIPAIKNIPIGILSQKMNHDRNVRIANLDPMVYVMKQPYRISFRVEQILPEDNIEVNNAIITWTVLSDLLEQALDQKNRSVAIQMLETMRRSYDDKLSKLAVDNSAIVMAMRHSDSGIRRRASKLYVRMMGEKPLYEKPEEEAITSGRVLIVHPQSGEIRPLHELLTQVGFQVAVIDSMDTAVKVIPNLDSLKFVISSKEFGGLAATELRKALAKKFRLNPTPLTFVARADSYREAPVAKPIFDTQLQQLLKLSGGVGATPSERVEQAKTCLGFLKKVVADRDAYAYADPIRHEKKIVNSLRHPELASESIEVLAELATPSAQKALVNFASESSRSVADRSDAVKAFSTAIQKRGILLTKADILEQYARYNESEALDQQTQQVLASILDAMEDLNSSN